MLSKLTGLQLSVGITHKSNTRGKKMEKLIAEQKSNAREQQVLTAKMREELFEYDQYLCDSSREFEESAQKLHALAARHESIAKELNEERMKITMVIKEAENYEQKMKDNLKSLEVKIASKDNDFNSVIQVVKCVDHLEEWRDKCQQQFPDPKYASLTKHSEFIESLNKEETLAFMDLRWDGSIQGRIHILLSPDTPLARNFRILCTGELGHTYLNTEFSYTFQNFCLDEYIVGGYYECDRGGLGRTVIEGINFNDSVYERQNAVGLVFLVGSSSEYASQFAIITSSGRLSHTRGNVFGKLQDGLEIVRKACDIIRAKKTVEITDCGVVLPL